MTWFLAHYNKATAMKFNVMKALPNLYRCPFYIPWLYAFEYLLPIALHWICGALACKLHTRACSESLRDRHRNPCRPKFIATPGPMGRHGRDVDQHQQEGACWRRCLVLGNRRKEKQRSGSHGSALRPSASGLAPLGQIPPQGCRQPHALEKRWLARSENLCSLSMRERARWPFMPWLRGHH